MMVFYDIISVINKHMPDHTNYICNYNSGKQTGGYTCVVRNYVNREVYQGPDVPQEIKPLDENTFQ